MKKQAYCGSTRNRTAQYSAMPSSQNQADMKYRTGHAGVISLLPSLFLSSLVPIVLTIISILLLIIVVVPVIL